MTTEDITIQLKLIIKPYVKNMAAFEALTPETNFITDLQINSANLVDVILDIEEHFNIEIDNESMEKMTDVQSVLSIIESKLKS